MGNLALAKGMTLPSLNRELGLRRSEIEPWRSNFSKPAPA
jgi:hypothetical protein